MAALTMFDCHSENKLAGNQESRSRIMGTLGVLIQQRQDPHAGDWHGRGDHPRQQLGCTGPGEDCKHLVISKQTSTGCSCSPLYPLTSVECKLIFIPCFPLGYGSTRGIFAAVARLADSPFPVSQQTRIGHLLFKTLFQELWKRLKYTLSLIAQMGEIRSTYMGKHCCPYETDFK